MLNTTLPIPEQPQLISKEPEIRRESADYTDYTPFPLVEEMIFFAPQVSHLSKTPLLKCSKKNTPLTRAD